MAVNLFTHKAESLPQLDNTVNSNQDPVISNYRLSAARGGAEVGCDEVKHVSSDLFTTQALIQGFIPEYPLHWKRCTQQSPGLFAE